MKKLLQLILTVVAMAGCTAKEVAHEIQDTASLVPAGLVYTADEGAGAAWESISPDGNTVSSRINVPPGFVRQPAQTGSVLEYLRELPTRKDGALVYLHNGDLKNRQDVHAAVIDLEIGTKNLLQCADAIMRLRAEYLFRQKKYDLIRFNFTSGDPALYSKYAQGFRASVKGNKVNWVKKAGQDYSYNTFRQYLDLVFTYAGTASLTKELKPVKNLKEITAGDVFIQGGFPGHAVMVMDVAIHPKTGEKLFLLAQSYMPAQQVHLLKNWHQSGFSPWYSTQTRGPIYTPEWTFHQSDLKRFDKW